MSTTDFNNPSALARGAINEHFTREEAVAFQGYACRAWGETELPCVEVVRDMAGVSRFLVREWLGSEDDRDASGELTLPSVMAEIAEHDWKDGEWSAPFEIGGVSVEPVYSFTHALPAQPAEPVVAVPEGWKLVPVEPTPEMVKEGGRYVWPLPATDAYRAMLAASPLPQQKVGV